jgi:hypothetical protein
LGSITQEGGKSYYEIGIHAIGGNRLVVTNFTAAIFQNSGSGIYALRTLAIDISIDDGPFKTIRTINMEDQTALNHITDVLINQFVEGQETPLKVKTLVLRLVGVHVRHADHSVYMGFEKWNPRFYGFVEKDLP